LIGLLILSAIAVQAPQPAEAGAFATEITQVLNHAQLAMTYIRQGLQLQNEIKMYTDMISAAIRLRRADPSSSAD